MKMKSNLLLVFVLIGCSVQSTAQSPDAEAWRRDLEAYRSGLEKNHIDLYHSIDAQDFNRDLERQIANAANLSKAQRWVELMRLTRRVGDGHTAIPLWVQAKQIFPLVTTVVGDAVLVTGVRAQDKQLLGGIIQSVNGVPVAEVLAGLSQIVPFVENEYSERVRVGDYFPFEDLLVGLGFTTPGAATQFNILVKDDVRSLELTAVTREEVFEIITDRITPLHPEPFFTAQENEAIWYDLNRDQDTVYIRFDAYPSAKKMEAFADRLLRRINNAAVANIIIDLRENYGGDFYNGLILASRLNLVDSISWLDGVYVLIGPRTFSAAMSNAIQFKEVLNAKLVGSPTGGNPCGYQDMGQFSLPASSLLVTYSKRRFCFVETSAGFVAPDVYVETPISDYLDGQDSVLAWVMDDIERRAKTREAP